MDSENQKNNFQIRYSLLKLKFNELFQIMFIVIPFEYELKALFDTPKKQQIACFRIKRKSNLNFNKIFISNLAFALRKRSL